MPAPATPAHAPAPSATPPPVFSLRADAPPHPALLGTEWLLTNALGGFAMGTAAGLPSRRYHALLVAALTPPVGRIVALNGLVDRVTLSLGTGRERTVELSTFRFATSDPAHAAAGVIHPDGVANLIRFERTAEGSCSWVYEAAGARITRTLHLFRGQNTAAISYRVEDEAVVGGAGVGGGGGWMVEARPLVSMRDYHHLLQGGHDGMFRVGCDGGCEVTLARAEDWAAHWPALRIVGAGGGAFRAEPAWWRQFRYDLERDRGMSDQEDLYSPGVFSWTASAREGALVSPLLYASTDPLDASALPSIERDAAARREHVGTLTRAVLAQAPRADAESKRALAALAAASDDFPVVRVPPDRAGARPHPLLCSSILAGYPWFADWGRDTMISLPGLCLATGRRAEALAILRVFAAHCRDGLIPNRFDDNTSAPYYNTADASLWFLHAATEYLRTTGDREGFEFSLRRACLDIVENYRSGTHVPASDHGGTIRMDPRDYLIAAGSAATQLTWMDARRDNTVFTPRHGKPVELSALWHHGLASLAEALVHADAPLVDRTLAADLRTLAQAVAASFQRRFFSASLGCCVDRLVPVEGAAPGARAGGADQEWEPVPEIRPNQVFAASLAHSPLTPEQRTAVIGVVRSRLLTRHGLRTLDPADPNYHGRFTGSLYERDAAYHTGTAWPWLLPPLAEAVMRSGSFSPASRVEAKRMLAPLIAWLGKEGGGQIPEVFDGDDRPEAPQRPGGCPAQAWSVAETLRVLVLVLAESGA